MVINHLLTGMHPHDGDVPAMVHGFITSRGWNKNIVVIFHRAFPTLLFPFPKK